LKSGFIEQMANPNWKKGVSGNPKGRIPGVPNKRNANEELFHRLKARGDRDPADVLSEIASDQKAEANLRVAAANGLMPYKYSKRGLTSEPVPLVFVIEPVQLPHARAASVPEVVENLQYLSDLRATGRLDLDAADRLISDQRIIGANLIEAAKLEVAQGGPPRQEIHISGGLPQLPGTNVDLSSTAYGRSFPAVINGEHVRDGQIVPTTDVIPPYPGWPDAPKPKDGD
jgi:hypothetical protein